MTAVKLGCAGCVGGQVAVPKMHAREAAEEGMLSGDRLVMSVEAVDGPVAADRPFWLFSDDDVRGRQSCLSSWGVSVRWDPHVRGVGDIASANAFAASSGLMPLPGVSGSEH